MEMGENELPTYYEFISKAFASYRSVFEKSELFPSQNISFIDDVKQRKLVTRCDVVLLFLCAIFWTLMRDYLTKEYFLPFARYVKMAHCHVEKFPESAWKLCWYLFSWAFTSYTLFFCGYDYFYRPLDIWKGWTSEYEMPTEIYFVYLIQMSFYVHSVYGTLYVDMWRKDSIVMLIHHFLTIILIGFSYAARYHKIGLLVMFLHDVSDIALEFAKCSNYMKTRDNKIDHVADRLATIGFVFFASTWFWFRLYWFPLKVLYSASYGAALHIEQGIPFYYLFNFLLWFLFSLHLYWFLFIVILSLKIMTGSIKEVEDTREYAVESETKNV